MSFLVLKEHEISELLPMAECIEVVAGAFAALDAGEMTQPLRSVFIPPDANGIMAWMPAHHSGAAPVFGMKVLCLVPSNPTRGLDAHQGLVLVSDGETGQLRALLDAAPITAIRTAAASAVATRLLARADASTLAIVGTGVQALSHLAAIPLVRPVDRVRIAGRTPERAQEFVSGLGERYPFAIEAAASTEQAVRGADIVVTATNTREPILRREWLSPGTHVNAVGASQRTHRELDTQTVADATLFTDRRQSLENEAAEYHLAREESLISSTLVPGELGELVNGKIPGRTSAEEITLFRSLGLAVFDVAAAEYVVGKAHAAGAGVTVEF